MVAKLLKFLIGGQSKRMRMTLIYTIIFVALSIIDKLDAVSFGTFSGIFGVWIIADSAKKGKDD